MPIFNPKFRIRLVQKRGRRIGRKTKVIAKRFGFHANAINEALEDCCNDLAKNQQFSVCKNTKLLNFSMKIIKTTNYQTKPVLQEKAALDHLKDRHHGFAISPMKKKNNDMVFIF